VYKIHSS